MIIVNLIENEVIRKYIFSRSSEDQKAGFTMPTYEYQCRECGHSFDEYQSITADPLVVCPKCGKHSLKRVMGTGGGLIFKGSGFYLTDYKKNGSSASTTPAKKEQPGEKKSTESKPSSAGTSAGTATPEKK